MHVDVASCRCRACSIVDSKLLAMSSHNSLLRAAWVVITLATLSGSARAAAQAVTPVPARPPGAPIAKTLDSLAPPALAVNPKTRAAAARVRAARARAGPAGARPDPM